MKAKQVIGSDKNSKSGIALKKQPCKCSNCDCKKKVDGKK